MLVPLLAFAESCIGIGIFVSGALLLALSVFLFSNGVAGVELISALAMFGALLGDHAGFLVGYKVGPKLLELPSVAKYRERIEKAESFVRRYGSAAVFIGRFVPAIRSIVPALIGVSGFSRRRYFFVDALACLMWAIALALLVLGIDIVIV